MCFSTVGLLFNLNVEISPFRRVYCLFRVSEWTVVMKPKNKHIMKLLPVPRKSFRKLKAQQ